MRVERRQEVDRIVIQDLLLIQRDCQIIVWSGSLDGLVQVLCH